MRWRKVTLLGVGLLGGSLGMALRRRALAEQVHGYVRRDSSVAECLRAEAVDSASTDLLKSVANADLLVLCTPLAQMGPLTRAALEGIQPGALITDVGSVKAELAAELEPLCAARGVSFVGSHPMAGSEKMGVSAARANLFEQAVCVVTPTSLTEPRHTELIEELWRGVGARTLRLNPEVHDALVARSSHLPHVLTSHLASYVLDAARPAEQAQLCANGFRDTTRVASGSPEMWRDIVMMNKKEVSLALEDYMNQLRNFQARLETGDPAEIQRFFEKAKSLRDAWATSCGARAGE